MISAQLHNKNLYFTFVDYQCLFVTYNSLKSLLGTSNYQTPTLTLCPLASSNTSNYVVNATSNAYKNMYVYVHKLVTMYPLVLHRDILCMGSNDYAST